MSQLYRIPSYLKHLEQQEKMYILEIEENIVVAANVISYMHGLHLGTFLLLTRNLLEVSDLYYLSAMGEGE